MFNLYSTEFKHVKFDHDLDVLIFCQGNRGKNRENQRRRPKKHRNRDSNFLLKILFNKKGLYFLRFPYLAPNGLFTELGCTVLYFLVNQTGSRTLDVGGFGATSPRGHPVVLWFTTNREPHASLAHEKLGKNEKT